VASYPDRPPAHGRFEPRDTESGYHGSLPSTTLLNTNEGASATESFARSAIRPQAAAMVPTAPLSTATRHDFGPSRPAVGTGDDPAFDPHDADSEAAPWRAPMLARRSLRTSAAADSYGPTNRADRIAPDDVR
jgi:hypothetical protein